MNNRMCLLILPGRHDAIGQPDSQGLLGADLPAGEDHVLGACRANKAGQALGLSRAVAYRNWKYARAWLREALET